MGDLKIKKDIQQQKMIDEDTLRIIWEREREKDLENLTEECRRLLQIDTSPYRKTDGSGNRYCGILPCEEKANFSKLCPYASEDKILVNAYNNGEKHKCLHP